MKHLFGEVSGPSLRSKTGDLHALNLHDQTPSINMPGGTTPMPFPLGAPACGFPCRPPRYAGWQRDLSVSYENIGGVQQAQGDLKAALKSYSDSLAIRERLAKADPNNAGWQRDLAVSYAKLASAYRKSNETTKAHAALAEGRAILGKLVEQHSDQVQWKQDLAWFDAQIAELGKTSSKKKPARR